MKNFKEDISYIIFNENVKIEKLVNNFAEIDKKAKKLLNKKNNY